jgi:DnaK suppressor protein
MFYDHGGETMHLDDEVLPLTIEKDIAAMALGEGKLGIQGINPLSSGHGSRFLLNLVEKREVVEKTLNHLMETLRAQKSKDSRDDFTDDTDNAEREISAHMHYKLIERKNNELERIKILIRRALKEEEFGWCEECGERIPDERLLILPEATRCVPCQKELEKFDQRRSLGRRSRNFSGSKNGFEWEGEEDSGEQGIFILKPDMEYMSFVNIEETDLGDKPGQMD